MTDHVTNYDSFRDCLATFVIEQLSPAPLKTPRKRRAGKKNQPGRKYDAQTNGQASCPAEEQQQPVTDAEELADFISYLADEIFNALPAQLRTLSYAATRNDAELAAQYTPPLPQSTIEATTALMPAPALDSLSAYGLVPPPTEPSDMQKSFVAPLLAAYTAAVTAAPANLGPDFGVRAAACEICARDWIPLTYHHLIPRGVHAKAVKRGWHEEWRLNSVAWLCRACHSMVHRVASNEELAREWYSVDLLLEREDVRGFAGWVGGVRWKKR